MNVLVTFAIDAEFAPWRKLRTFHEKLLDGSQGSGGLRVQETDIGGHTVWIYLTGIGIQCFNFEAAINAGAAGVDAVLCSGLAGSLNSRDRALTVVAPRRVGFLREATGIGVSKCLLELAGNKGATLIDLLLTSDHIIDTAEQKARLSSFADAVDMESFHVVSEFSSHHIPVAVIRAISDGNEEEMPIDFEKCLDKDGSIRVMPLLKDLVKSPGKIPALIRLGRQSRAAAEKLASFLDEYIQSLPEEVRNDRAMETVGE